MEQGTAGIPIIQSGQSTGSSYGGIAGGLLGSVLGPLGAGAGSMLGSKMFGGEKTANDMKLDMDTLYEGTTPWERLGATGSTVASLNSANTASRAQRNASATQAMSVNKQVNAQTGKIREEENLLKKQQDKVEAETSSIKVNEDIKEPLANILQGPKKFLDEQHEEDPQTGVKNLTWTPNWIKTLQRKYHGPSPKKDYSIETYQTPAKRLDEMKKEARKKAKQEVSKMKLHNIPPSQRSGYRKVYEEDLYKKAMKSYPLQK